MVLVHVEGVELELGGQFLHPHFLLAVFDQEPDAFLLLHLLYFEMQHESLADLLNVRGFHAFHHPFIFGSQMDFDRVGSLRLKRLRGE